MASSVIFIGSPEKSPKSCRGILKELFCVAPNDVSFRIFASFIPPFTKKYQKVHVDFQGPLLALLMLTALLNYGYSLKNTVISRSPTEVMLIYSIAMPILCFTLCKLGYSYITFCETASLVGYALYGYLLTLVTSFLCFEERSNFFFFLCLIFFGGLSTFRMCLVFLGTIQLPAMRLLVCTITSVVNLLYLIFLHFAYMHRTFVYKSDH